MSTITLPNIRVSSDLTVSLKLKDGGVAIDWSTLTNIKVSIYSDAQRALAGRCSVAIDEDDATLLVCTYAANKPQYVGVNRVVVSAKYMNETKTYDKPAFNFVRWTDDQEGQTITIDDPDIDVEISVEDVSSSILQEAVDAANTAAERANEAAEAAEHMVDIHTGPAGKSPYIGENGHWYEWDEETDQYVDTETNAKGDTGETPDISIGTVTTVEPGTPAAASMTGTPEAPVLNLSIPKGLVGATPAFTVGTVTTGAPGSSVIVTITGTAEAPVLNVTIPQGMQGNTGSSVDYPYELVNNLTTNDATKGLTAAQGVVLDGKVSQLEAEVNGEDSSVDFSTASYYKGSMDAAGKWTNTAVGANKYSCWIIPMVPNAKVTIKANSSKVARIRLLTTFNGQPSDNYTQTVLRAWDIPAGETMTFIPDAGTNYIYLTRYYYDTATANTPTSMSFSVAGIADNVAELVPATEANTTAVYGKDITPRYSTADRYMNGTNIYSRSGFVVESAPVPAGNYVVSFIGAGQITYADGVAVGYTNNPILINALYTPLQKVQYRTGDYVEIPVTVPVASDLIIGYWNTKLTDLKVRAMDASHPLFGHKILYVGTDANKTYQSLDNVLDGTVAGEKTAVLVTAGTYSLSDDWTAEEMANASYSDVASGVEGAWCGTPVKDGVSIIGVDGKDKCLITAECPSSGAANSEISAFNFMGEVTIKGLTITSNRMRYTIHDDFSKYNKNRSHNMIDCNIYSLNNSVAYGAARHSGETINVRGCIFDGFSCHAASDFLLPATINIEDSIIKYGLGIGDHTTGVDCPVNVINTDVAYISYYKNSQNDTQRAILTVHGGNIPAISPAWDKYHHDGLVYKLGGASAIPAGTAVKSNGMFKVEAMGASDGVGKFVGVALLDIPVISSENKHDYYPIIAKGYVPTSLVGISSFNLGDAVGIVEGALAVAESNIVGYIECVKDGVGYIRLI